MFKKNTYSIVENVLKFNGKNLVVIASAGSGKTAVLTEKIKRMVEKKKRKLYILLYSLLILFMDQYRCDEEE